MNGKILAIIAVAVAVIAGSISAVILTTKRADIARAQLEIASNRADAARANLKAKEKEADAEKMKLAAVEREKEKLQEEKAKAEAETKKLAQETELAEKERIIEEAKADAAEEQKKKAAEERQTEQLRLKVADMTNKTVMAAIRLAEAKAKAEETRLQAEKLKNEREVALIKAKDLKRINFEEWEQQLVEWKRDLEERERAIAPDKTAADLEWIGNGEDTVIDDKGNLVRQPKRKYLAENDRTLSPATRELARTLRLRDEAGAARRTAARNAIVGALEKLYAAARDADRPGDAEYFKKSIRAMYPDWKYGQPVTNVTAKAAGGVSNAGK